jgi:hypothetical protein
MGPGALSVKEKSMPIPDDVRIYGSIDPEAKPVQGELAATRSDLNATMRGLDLSPSDRAWLAKEAGVSPATVSRWTRPEGSPGALSMIPKSVEGRAMSELPPEWKVRAELAAALSGRISQTPLKGHKLSALKNPETRGSLEKAVKAVRELRAGGPGIDVYLSNHFHNAVLSQTPTGAWQLDMEYDQVTDDPADST